MKILAWHFVKQEFRMVPPNYNIQFRMGPPKLGIRFCMVPPRLGIQFHMDPLDGAYYPGQKIPNCGLVGHSWLQMMCLYQANVLPKF